MLSEVFTQPAHWAARGRGRLAVSGSQWITANLCSGLKKIAHCTVIFPSTGGTILAQSYTKLHLYVHLKQAMKSIVKKPVTNTTQIYSLQSKIQSKGKKAIPYFLNASFIPLFSFWNQWQTHIYWWEKIENTVFLTYFVFFSKCHLLSSLVFLTLPVDYLLYDNKLTSASITVLNSLEA